MAKTLLALSKKKDQPDYVLDVEFHTQLKELLQEFGLNSKQVVSILLAREKFSSHHLNPLLDLIPVTRNDQPPSIGSSSSDDRAIESAVRPRARESTPA